VAVGRDRVDWRGVSSWCAYDSPTSIVRHVVLLENAIPQPERRSVGNHLPLSPHNAASKSRWSPELKPTMINSYIICSTPRSGSTLLCKLLASTGRTGNPNSFYHRQEFMREWAAEWGLPEEAKLGADYDREYLAGAITAGKGGTPIFGMRLQRDYAAMLSQTLDRIHPGLPSDANRFERAFGEVLYLHLSRRDKVAQAVSLVKGEQTGLWHLNADGTELERVGVPRKPFYDFESIYREFASLQRQDRAWEEWFDQQGIAPLRIEYEALSEDPAGTVAQVCEALGVSVPEPDSLKIGVAKIADAESAEWVRRFRAELASRS
jgi:trehalose 2-sulfotransferase